MPQEAEELFAPEQPATWRVVISIQRPPHTARITYAGIILWQNLTFIFSNLGNKAYVTGAKPAVASSSSPPAIYTAWGRVGRVEDVPSQGEAPWQL